MPRRRGPSSSGPSARGPSPRRASSSRRGCAACRHGHRRRRRSARTGIPARGHHDGARLHRRQRTLPDERPQGFRRGRHSEAGASHGGHRRGSQGGRGCRCPAQGPRRRPSTRCRPSRRPGSSWRLRPACERLRRRGRLRRRVRLLRILQGLLGLRHPVRQNAISRKDLGSGAYEYAVDPERCIGCGFCAGACPCGIWQLAENVSLESVNGLK